MSGTRLEKLRANLRAAPATLILVAVIVAVFGFAGYALFEGFVRGMPGPGSGDPQACIQAVDNYKAQHTLGGRSLTFTDRIKVFVKHNECDGDL